MGRTEDVTVQWWSEKREENKIEEKRRKMNQGSLISLSHLKLLEREEKSEVSSHHVLFRHLSDTLLVGRLSENSHYKRAATSSA